MTSAPAPLLPHPTAPPALVLADHAASAWMTAHRPERGDRVDVGPDRATATAFETLHPDRRALVLVRRDQVPFADIGIELWTSLPREPIDDRLCEALARIGVSRVHPVLFERTHPKRYEAASGRVRSMAPAPFEAALAARPLVLSAGAACDLPALIAHGRPIMPRHLLVGPEGGFTPAERQRIVDAGLQRASLGSATLRIETAALAAVATLAGAAWIRSESDGAARA